MHWTRVVAISVVSAIAVVGITFSFVGGRGWGPSHEGQRAGAPAMHANWSEGGRGWNRPGTRGRHGFRAFHDERSSDWIEAMLVLGERRLDLRPARKPAWDELGAARRAALDETQRKALDDLVARRRRH